MNNDIEKECPDCGKKFIFSAGEQRFYEEKNLVPPKRCKECRDARKIVKN